MKGLRQVLVKIVLFQLKGRGHPQDDATPNIFADSKRLYKGFQMRYPSLQKCFEKVVEIKEMSFLLSKCLVSIAHHCISKYLLPKLK